MVDASQIGWMIRPSSDCCLKRRATMPSAKSDNSASTISGRRRGDASITAGNTLVIIHITIGPSRPRVMLSRSGSDRRARTLSP